MGDLCFLLCLAGFGWLVYTVGSAIMGIGTAIATTVPTALEQTATTVAEEVVEETAVNVIDAALNYFFGGK